MDFIILGAMKKTQYSVIYVLYKIPKAITVANRKNSILSVHELWLFDLILTTVFREIFCFGSGYE